MAVRRDRNVQCGEADSLLPVGLTAQAVLDGNQSGTDGKARPDDDVILSAEIGVVGP